MSRENRHQQQHAGGHGEIGLFAPAEEGGAGGEQGGDKPGGGKVDEGLW